MSNTHVPFHDLDETMKDEMAGSTAICILIKNNTIYSVRGLVLTKVFLLLHSEIRWRYSWEYLCLQDGYLIPVLVFS